MEERRKYTRMDESVTTKYRILKTALKDRSSTKDLSVSGVRLPVVRRFPPGTVLVLEFFIPQRIKPIIATGKVVWLEENVTAKPPFEVGIEFIDIDLLERDQLNIYMQKTSDN